MLDYPTLVRHRRNLKLHYSNPVQTALDICSIEVICYHAYFFRNDETGSNSDGGRDRQKKTNVFVFHEGS